MADLLVLSHVTKVFQRAGGAAAGGAVRAVDDVSLTLGKNEILGIVGRSGSGKTTLGLIMCGVLRASGGSIAWAPNRGRARPQMIFQDPRESLNPRMKVWESVAEPLLVRGLGRAERRRRVGEVMTQVQLSPKLGDRFPHELSGGERQRIALARALVAEPDLVVADEPTSMLDSTTAAEIVSLLRRLKEVAGTALVFITHDLAQAAAISDRIAVMAGGKLVELGPPDRICTAPRAEETKRLLWATRAREAALKHVAGSLPRHLGGDRAEGSRPESAPSAGRKAEGGLD